MRAVEGNASVHRACPVRGITGEGREELLGRGSLSLNKMERGAGAGVLDVLTPLSNCKQVEKIDRRILGVSYMCGMDFHNGILCCGFLCARIISLYFSTLFLPLPCVFSASYTANTPRDTTPHIYCKGYYAFTTARLPRLCI